MARRGSAVNEAECSFFDNEIPRRLNTEESERNNVLPSPSFFFSISFTPTLSAAAQVRAPTKNFGLVSAESPPPVLYMRKAPAHKIGGGLSPVNTKQGEDESDFVFFVSPPFRNATVTHITC